MAYRRRSTTRSRSTGRRKVASRRPARRSLTRRASGRSAQTLRIVIEQPAANPVARPAPGVMAAAPAQQARF